MTAKIVKAHSTGRSPVPMKFERVKTYGMSQACIVPTSHKPHSGGYVYLVPRESEVRQAQRLHRLVYLDRYGPDAIPSGHELDHICGLRACCNVNHLRVIEKTDHVRITLGAARAERMEEAWGVWEQHGRPNGYALSKILGIPNQRCYRYIKEWLAEDEALAAWRAAMETNEAA